MSCVVGHGNCGADGVCSCLDGWGGSFCEAPPSCASAVVDANGTCCNSTLRDVGGACCAAGAGGLDPEGYCCPGPLDACGRCPLTASGTQVLD